jgi:crotonobetainyl-CoA:carnitine CoA-transferase CaiB-like acyl-CoA transferase
MAGLLRGVRVLESAQLFTGDYTGMLLGDEGADVTKVESPFRGDYLRDFLGQMKPHTRGHSPLHMILNRNKQSVAIDLRKDEGKEVFWKLLEDCDVFLDGNTTGALDSLGIGYEELHKRLPNLIYAHVSGLGETGPYAKVPTHGQSMNALAGTEALKIENGFAVPSEDYSRNIEGSMGVVVGPLYLAYGIAAALYRRATTGEGCYLEVGCSDAIISAAWMSVVNKMNAERIGEDATGMGGAAAGGNGSKYNHYWTKDQKFMLVALIEHHFYKKFVEGLGREDLLADEYYNTKDIEIDWGPTHLRPILQDIFATRTLAEWMAFAAEHDVVLAPASTIDDLRTDPHLVVREAIVEYVHPTGGPVVVTGNPIKVRGEHFEVTRHAPALGEQTHEQLLKLGLSQDVIDQLAAAGITN